MSFLETLISALPGSFDEVLRRLLGLLSEAREKFPEAGEQIDWLVGQLEGDVAGALQPEALKAAVLALVDLFTGFKFGPPNPGAAAIT